MKRIISLFLTISMLFLFCSCGVQFRKTEDPQKDGTAETSANRSASFKTGETNMALVVSPAGVEDGDMNELVCNACTGFSTTYHVSFSYYISPDRVSENIEDLLRGVVDDGFDVIILAGQLFAQPLADMIADCPDVTFIGVDISGSDFPQNFIIPSNLCCVSFKEEVLGYLAGYAAVSMGYRHIGFLGSRLTDALTRYGTGFIQGADAGARAQAAEVTLDYVFAGTENPDDVVNSYLKNWYSASGIQLIFATGENMAQAAARAASECGTGRVIGAGTDRFRQINAYGEDLCLSCAEKNYSTALKDVLWDIFVDRAWENHAGKLERYGLDAGLAAQSNYVQLSYYATEWNEFFTNDDYALLVGQIASGEISVEKNAESLPELCITVNYFDNIK